MAERQEQAVRHPIRTRAYRVARGFAAVVFHTICPLKYYHTERIPKEAPYILISNHLSWLDPLAVGKPIRDFEVTFLGKKELASNRLTQWLFKKLHMIVVDRHNSDMEAMRACMRVLREGEILGIFPEGTRHHEGIMEQTEAGVGLIALRSRVPLLPMLVDGKIRPFHRTRVWVGETIETEDLRAEGVNKETADALMKRIQETYRQMQEDLRKEAVKP